MEDHLQRYLAEQIERIGKGAKLVRREYPTAIGPVDIMAVNAEGEHVLWKSNVTAALMASSS